MYARYYHYQQSLFTTMGQGSSHSYGGYEAGAPAVQISDSELAAIRNRAAFKGDPTSQKCIQAQTYANGKCEHAADSQFGGMTGAGEAMMSGLACMRAQQTANKLCGK